VYKRQLLFTAATNEEAPFLEKSNLIWRTDINRAGLNSHSDEIESYPTLRLLQIDLAVRDSRADEFSGWVFGTFTYNPLRNLTKEIGKFDGWEKVEPLGLMFGNDPEVKVAGFKNLKESLINKDIEKTQHLGCGQRLNGTVDNPRSSCIACHTRDAEVQISKTDNHSINFTEIKYKISSPTCDIFENTLDQTDLSYWFKNIKPLETFSRKTKRVKYFPLHNVLQMQIGITRYCDAFPNHCRDENFRKKLKETDIETPQMKESSRGEE
jgi:hypothetical protein